MKQPFPLKKKKKNGGVGEHQSSRPDHGIVNAGYGPPISWANLKAQVKVDWAGPL